MHAATVEVLVNKAHLEPDVAVAFAEAFDMAIANAQLVTVPVIDTRFAAIDLRFAAVDARFDALEAKMETRFAAVDARFASFEAKMDVRFRESDARTDARIEKCKAELMRWVLLVMLGNVALSAGATAVLNFLQRGH